MRHLIIIALAYCLSTLGSSYQEKFSAGLFLPLKVNFFNNTHWQAKISPYTQNLWQNLDPYKTYIAGGLGTVLMGYLAYSYYFTPKSYLRELIQEKRLKLKDQNIRKKHPTLIFDEDSTQEQEAKSTFINHVHQRVRQVLANPVSIDVFLKTEKIYYINSKSNPTSLLQRALAIAPKNMPTNLNPGGYTTYIRDVLGYQITQHDRDLLGNLKASKCLEEFTIEQSEGTKENNTKIIKAQKKSTFKDFSEEVDTNLDITARSNNQSNANKNKHIFEQIIQGNEILQNAIKNSNSNIQLIVIER